MSQMIIRRNPKRNSRRSASPRRSSSPRRSASPNKSLISNLEQENIKLRSEIDRLKHVKMSNITKRDVSFFEKYILSNFKIFKSGRRTNLIEQRENENLIYYAGRKTLELTYHVPFSEIAVKYLPFLSYGTINNYMRFHAYWHLRDIACIFKNASAMLNSLSYAQQIMALKDAGQTETAFGYIIHGLSQGFTYGTNLSVYLSSFIMGAQGHEILSNVVQEGGYINIEKLMTMAKSFARIGNYQYVLDRNVKNLLRAEEDIHDSIHNYLGHYVFYMIGALFFFFLTYIFYGFKKRKSPLAQIEHVSSRTPSPLRMTNFGRRRISRRRVSRRKVRKVKKIN